MYAPGWFRPIACGLAFAVFGCAGPSQPLQQRPAASPGLVSHDDVEERGASPVVSTPPDLPKCDDDEQEPHGEGDSEEADHEHATIDDGFEPPSESESDAPAAPPPFADLTDADIAARLRTDIGALGSISIGGPHSGVLLAPVRMPTGDNWELVSPGRAWGTQEAVDALTHAIDAVATRFPDTPKLHVGDLSARRGGPLPPHVSHQSGRDVDLGYYLAEGHRWYAPANASNLDRARTWHLVRTLIADSDVDLILVDLRVQRLLKAYALTIGEDPDWLDQIFQAGGKSRRPILFHVAGHATHLHVRFFSPMAQELGRRAYRTLVARRLIAPPTRYVMHTVKRGETLSHLMRRYKVTAEEFKKANELKKDVLRVNKTYKVPQRGGIALPARVALPPRRTPPPPRVAIPEKVVEPSPSPCRASLRDTGGNIERRGPS